MEVVQIALMDVAKSSIGVYAADTLNVSNMLPQGPNVVTKNLSKGVLYSGISDGIDYLASGQTKLGSGNVVAFLDDCAFLGGLSGAAEVTRLDRKFYDFIQDSLRVSGDTAEILTESVIISSGRFTAHMLEQYIRDGTASQATSIVRRPVSFLLTKMNH
jgi:hypothetical protein